MKLFVKEHLREAVAKVQACNPHGFTAEKNPSNVSAFCCLDIGLGAKAQIHD